MMQAVMMPNLPVPPQVAQPAPPRARPQPIFVPPQRANAQLTANIEERIGDVVSSSMTIGWQPPVPGNTVAASAPFPPPITDDYEFQTMMRGVGGRVTKRTWDFIRKNETLFYQSANSTYYLRMRSDNMGVAQAEWRRVAPDSRVNTFRIFELFDTTALNHFAPHQNRIVFTEIDLASRARQHRITIDLEDNDSFGTFAAEIAAIGDYFANGPVANPLPPAMSELANFAYILMIIANQRFNAMQLAGNLNISLAYETFSSNANEVILLSKGQSLRFPATINDLATTIGVLLWPIRSSLMSEHYGENGNHVFHPRTFRMTFKPLPLVGGNLYYGAPIPMVMPRGGCMSTQMPLKLLKKLKGLVVSHDLLLTGAPFDNNCGIREALIQMGYSINSPNDVKRLFALAAELRAATSNVPTFIK